MTSILTKNRISRYGDSSVLTERAHSDQINMYTHMTNRRRRRIRRIQKIKTRSKQIICIPAFKVLIRIRLECRVEYVILQRESCCYCCWMLLPFFVVLFCSARFFLFVYLSWRSLSAANVTHLLSIPTVDKQCYYYMYVVYIYIFLIARNLFSNGLFVP